MNKTLWTYTDRATGELRNWTESDQEALRERVRLECEHEERLHRRRGDEPIGGPGGD